jgi:hypothetical protein
MRRKTKSAPAPKKRISVYRIDTKGEDGLARPTLVVGIDAEDCLQQIPHGQVVTSMVLVAQVDKVSRLLMTLEMGDLLESELRPVADCPKCVTCAERVAKLLR